MSQQQTVIFFLSLLTSSIGCFIGGLWAGHRVSQKPSTPKHTVINQFPSTSEEVKNIRLPAYYVNNIPQLLDTTTIGASSVETKYLLRLCDCSTPSRAEWTGDRTKYTEAIQVALTAGGVVADGQGYRWIVSRDRFKQWVEKSHPLLKLTNLSST